MATVPALPALSQAPPPTRLRLSSPTEILAAVPYLLGFVPERSIVVLCLRGKQLGLTMRLDLDTPADELQAVVLARISGDGADTALIVIYDPKPSGSRRPGAFVSRPLVRALKRDGIKVQDSLGVLDGRFWSYQCQTARCCPPGGRPVPAPDEADHTRVAAAFVGIGSAPMLSRSVLEATLAPVSGKRWEAARASLTSEMRYPSSAPVHHWLAAVSRYTDGPPRPSGSLTPAEAARLIVSLCNVPIRDLVISWTADGLVVGLLAVLRELAPLALAPFDAQVLATLAWAAYSVGNGALAAIALERARTADPDHSLARLLSEALDAGIAPEQLRGISRQLLNLLPPDEWLPDWNPDDWNPDEL